MSSREETRDRFRCNDRLKGDCEGESEGENTSQCEGGSEGEWMRRATVQEAAFHSYAAAGAMIVSYVVRVATSRQLAETAVRTVLSQLQRKTPVLRIAFQQREDGELWLRETSRQVDFEVIHNADVKKWHLTMSQQTFKEEGPLWAARFLPWSPSQAEWVAATNVEDVEEDGEKLHVPYVSHVIMSFHHGIADGYSCVRIVSHFAKLLSKFLSGESIDDDIQVADVMGVEENNRIKSEVEATFRSDRVFLEERTRMLEKSYMKTLLHKAFPVKPGGPEEMDNITRIVDRDTHARFLSHCKNKGVTFHSGFCTVINAAIAKLVSPYAGDVEEIVISSGHAVDCRQYYTGPSKTAYGLGMRMFRIVVGVPHHVTDNFWSQARRFQEHLRHAHKFRSGFEAEVMGIMAGRSHFPLILDTTKPDWNKMLYYTTSNLLDVTPLLGDVGSDVRVQYSNILTSMHKFPDLIWNSFHTFRGRFIHSLTYNVHLLGNEAAKKLSDTIFEVYDEIA